MASFLPLLHDLLPIFMPSEVQVARSGELVAVEERAESPPWYQQQPPRVATSRDSGAVDIVNTELPSEECEPIQLLDQEGSRVSPLHGSTAERGSAVGTSNTGEDASVFPRHRGGPKVFRKNAMVGVSDRMCVTVLSVQPRSATAIHHHGEQDVIFYATTAGVLLTSQPLDTIDALRADIKGEETGSEEEQPRRLELGPGDFAFIPAWTEHQVVNEATDKDVSWVAFRYGAEPIQVDLDGWGGGRIKT